jgi:hypothetical protein
MEAIADSWLFGIFILIVVLFFLIKIIPESWRYLKNKRKILSDLPEESQKEIQKEYNNNVWSNLRRLLKWLFWI